MVLKPEIYAVLEKKTKKHTDMFTQNYKLVAKMSVHKEKQIYKLIDIPVNISL